MKKTRIPLTLCILIRDGKISLGMKKRGFAVGKWNGYGGKLHQGETIKGAALRELQEESGIVTDRIEKVGIIDFETEGNSEIYEVHVFKLENFTGEPVETEEMRPQWFDYDKIPFDNMWPDDKYWFPLLLSGKKFRGKFLFGKNDTILNQELVEVKKI